jgi:GrpB-like predicted nucleotidyltransferase (UPF0157 family)
MCIYTLRQTLVAYDRLVILVLRFDLAWPHQVTRAISALRSILGHKVLKF